MYLLLREGFVHRLDPVHNMYQDAAAAAAQRDVQMFVWVQCVQSISFIQGHSPGLTTNQYGNTETKWSQTSTAAVVAVAAAATAAVATV